MENLNIEEIKKVTTILDHFTLKSFRDLEGVNTGSAHKTVEQIVRYVCDNSREARRTTTILSSCLNHLLDGGTIESFYDYKVANATRKNQCKQDQDASLEELEMITKLLIELV